MNYDDSAQRAKAYLQKAIEHVQSGRYMHACLSITAASEFYEKDEYLTKILSFGTNVAVGLESMHSTAKSQSKSYDTLIKLAKVTAFGNRMRTGYEKVAKGDHAPFFAADQEARYIKLAVNALQYCIDRTA